MCLSLYKRSGHNNLLSDKSFSKVRRIASGSRLANPAEYIHPISAKLHINMKQNPTSNRLLIVLVLRTPESSKMSVYFFQKRSKVGVGTFYTGVLARYLKAWRYKILCPPSCLRKILLFIWLSAFSNVRINVRRNIKCGIHIPVKQLSYLRIIHLQQSCIAVKWLAV